MTCFKNVSKWHVFRKCKKRKVQKSKARLNRQNVHKKRLQQPSAKCTNGMPKRRIERTFEIREKNVGRVL